MKVPDEVFNQICADMDAREQAGEFDQLFKGEIHPREGPNKDEFLHSFSTGGNEAIQEHFSQDLWL